MENAQMIYLKNKRWCQHAMLLLLLFVWSGCRQISSPPADDILTFIPQVSMSDSFYEGADQYLHQLRFLESYKEHDGYIVALAGEVALLPTDFYQSPRFSILYHAKNDQLWMTYEGEAAIESDMATFIALQMPMEVGNVWDCQAIDQSGDKMKVTATIQDVSEGMIEVTYSGETVEEKRIFRENMGTTLFIKRVTFAGEQSYVGYHLRQQELTEVATYAKLEETTLWDDEQFPLGARNVVGEIESYYATQYSEAKFQLLEMSIYDIMDGHFLSEDQDIFSENVGISVMGKWLFLNGVEQWMNVTLQWNSERGRFVLIDQTME